MLAIGEATPTHPPSDPEELFGGVADLRGGLLKGKPRIHRNLQLLVHGSPGNIDRPRIVYQLIVNLLLIG